MVKTRAKAAAADTVRVEALESATAEMNSRLNIVTVSLNEMTERLSRLEEDNVAVNADARREKNSARLITFTITLFTVGVIAWSYVIAWAYSLMRSTT